MKVETHFIKNSDFKTISVSGVVGGMFTNDGQINMTFFTERPPLPKKVSIIIDDLTQAIISQTPSDDSKVGIVREVSVSANMDIRVARQIFEWLGIQIQTYDESQIKAHE